jgi:diaminohydroxyphosphoribosylaminopyrimidine deaminase / 5-amino-6-(5-phosphoribosylamino)uracil reductase
VLCAEGAADARVAALEKAGVTVTRVARARDGAARSPGGPGSGTGAGGLELDAVRAALAAAGFGAVLVEGGGTLASAMIDHGLAHRLYLFVAPKFLGADAVPAFRVHTPSQWHRSRVDKFGCDIMITLDRVETREGAH